MKSGIRVKKKGTSFEGVVDKTAALGVKVTWDLGVDPKTRPLWSNEKDLQLIPG